MAKDFAKAFYDSKRWKLCRAAYIKSVNGLCESCLKRGKITPGKIVHHKVYLTPENINDPNISLSHELLRYDCQDCHNAEHIGSGEGVVSEGLMFDANGDLVEVDELV